MATTTHGPVPLPVPLARLVASVHDAGSTFVPGASARYDQQGTGQLSRVFGTFLRAADRALMHTMRIVLSVIIDADLSATGRHVRGRHYW